MADKIRNIGILAHVDAGKTTLTEQLLYAGGAIRRVGSVDEGTSNTDSMDVERERGISVRAASTALEWRGVSVRVVDTPGHADFYAEVERSLRVLDGAILVVSSVEGVQLQTLTIWTALRELRIPTLIFVNKLDRMGSRPGELFNEMRTVLSPAVLPMQIYGDIETRSPFVRPAYETARGLGILGESLAGTDDALLEKYARNETFDWADIKPRIVDHCRRGSAFPVYFGAAMAGIGVPEVLDAIIDYLPPPVGKPSNPLSAVVFKIETGGPNGRVTHVRIFEGRISRAEVVASASMEGDERVSRVLKLSDALEAGDIGMLFGLRNSKVGHILGSSYAVPNAPVPTEPMLSARIVPEKAHQWNELLLALRQLEDEDPLLNVEWLEEQREISVRFFGEVQMEIVRDLLHRRFGIDAQFSEPRVLYKEAPVGVGESIIEYRTHGYADIHVRVEPLPLGRGVEFASQVKAEKIYHKFMKQIPEILENSRRKGLQGWEVTDFRFTVVDGHSKYDLGTQPGDFKIVTPLAFSRALERSGTRLLEPMMDFQISVPERYASQIYRDLVKMRATFADPSPKDGISVFVGQVPFAETFKYTAILYASAHGQGILKTKFAGYAPINSQSAS
jgi:ribosomal protection tetracycline resistance protein